MGRGKGPLNDMASSKISDGVLLEQLTSQYLSSCPLSAWCTRQRHH